MRPETKRWLLFARDDLATALVTLEGKRWAACSFHVQQAVEKALKALWVERKGEPPPRTHDLVRLGEEFGMPNEWRREIDILGRVYLVSRYPDLDVGDPLSLIDQAAAERHAELARRVISWVEQQLSMA